MVKVIWTDNALNDLEDIGNYIANDSIRYAKRIIQDLFYSTEILEQHPRAGTIVEEINDENIRQLIRNNYRIMYEIISEFQIDILTVHHTSRLIRNPHKKD